MNTAVWVLLVSPSDSDHRSFERIFSHTRWSLSHATDCREALRALQNAPIPVVVCEATLPDGTWRDVLEALRARPMPPLLIVTSDFPDTSLWAEALNLGAYDFLAKPFNPREVIAIISLAWLYWKEQARREPQPERARRAGGAAA